MADYPNFETARAVIKDDGRCNITLRTSVPCQSRPIERVGSDRRKRGESDAALKERTTYVALAALRMEADSVISRCKKKTGHRH